MSNTDYSVEEQRKSFLNLVKSEKQLNSLSSNTFELILEKKICLYCYVDISETNFENSKNNFDYFCSYICSILYLNIYSSIYSLNFNNKFSVIVPLSLVIKKNKFLKFFNFFNETNYKILKINYSDYSYKKKYTRITIKVTVKNTATLEIEEYEKRFSVNEYRNVNDCTLKTCINCLDTLDESKVYVETKNGFIGPFCDNICKKIFSVSLKGIFSPIYKYNLILPDNSLILSSNETIKNLKLKIKDLDSKIGGFKSLINNDKTKKIILKFYDS